MLVIVGARFGCGWGGGVGLGAGDELLPHAARPMVRVRASAPLNLDTICSPEGWPFVVLGDVLLICLHGRLLPGCDGGRRRRLVWLWRGIPPPPPPHPVRVRRELAHTTSSRRCTAVLQCR